MRKQLIGITLALTLGFVVIAMAQSQDTNNQTPQASASASALPTPAPATNAPTHATPRPAAKKGFTPDQAYKANCTRCHAELPTMDARRTATIVRHMRVRANLTEREAKAIFEYLNK